VKHPDSSFVIKYFDLIDEFIKVRSCSEEVLNELLQQSITDKASYRRRIVDVCVPEHQADIIPAISRMEDDYDLDIVEELLYQICIDVNPSLEIHQVSLPAKTASSNDPTEAGIIPRPEGSQERQQLFRKVLGLERSLKNKIVGQDEAIKTLVSAVKKAAVGLKRPNVPVGTFLLIGRTGTGKTELAKVMARSLYDDPGRLVRIDCSEYALPHEYAKLIGSPPGYIGHSEGGFLTETVRKKKSCVVLFDEIEKAHNKVHNLLLQLLDEGILTDSKGNVVSFSKTMVIMTSNLGIEKLDALRSRMGFGNGYEFSINEENIEEATLEGMRECFRPEFINRIDEVVVFNPLDVKQCIRIAHRMLKEVCGLLAKQGIHVEFSAGVKNALARDGFSEEYGARELRRLIKRRIEDPITDLILEHSLGTGCRIQVRMRRRETVIDLVSGHEAVRTA
jgi:ATP-dependent Clp protease ATP-binding subunit ClpC